MVIRSIVREQHSDMALKRPFTARKRSLGQGNIFRGICLSTGEGGLCPVGSLSRGVSVRQTPSHMVKSGW